MGYVAKTNIQNLLRGLSNSFAKLEGLNTWFFSLGVDVVQSGCCSPIAIGGGLCRLLREVFILVYIKNKDLSIVLVFSCFVVFL